MPGLLCSLAESLHFFVLPSENQNVFAGSADFEFHLILYSRIETPRHLVRSDFFAKIYTNFEIRRRVPRVKKMTKFKKNTHISLSLYICKHGLDPDQTRMVFRIERFVNLKMCACGRKYANR